eukprot:TRINITY_DN12652_c0_g1_i23.p1 TRINITY_DN12652_c0_g1~~TRINITY_DN12652_c0_g1_i23.p1  ORF type:complete len:467 (+),score=105.45 TRINITY_DN12652_c0_g1_i23:99-1499(+)
MLMLGEPMVDLDLGPDYQLIERIGCGAYSTVWRALHLPSRKEVAIKKEGNLFNDLVDCKRVLRELKLLRLLKHANIVELLDARINEEDKKFNSVSLVLEPGVTDLRKILKSARSLEQFHVKKIVYEILLALKYMHSVGVIHRDIKPANILIFEDESIKLCDFGLARCIAESYDPNTSKQTLADPDDLTPDTPQEAVPSKVSTTPTLVHRPNFFTIQKSHEEDKENRKTASHRLVSSRKPKLTTILTSHVVTRWYRAPEVILMEKNYGAAIDMWAVGCIFAELLAMLKGNSICFTDRKPLFPGTSCYPLSPGGERDSKNKEQDQLNVILKVLGTPGPDDCAFIANQELAKEIQSLPQWERENFKKKYPAAGKLAIELLDKLLVFNPSKRLTAEECLEHPYFEDVRDKGKESFTGNLEMINFEFESEVDLNKEKLRELILEEIEVYKKYERKIVLKDRNDKYLYYCQK